MPQLNLNFIDIPIPETCLWEQFDDEQKRLVIETLTRLLVKLTRANNYQEQIQEKRSND
jgi:phenylpyruvate tautomerase PptA (4-oxalocrotonate tautomerase family)